MLGPDSIEVLIRNRIENELKTRENERWSGLEVAYTREQEFSTNCTVDSPVHPPFAHEGFYREGRICVEENNKDDSNVKKNLPIFILWKGGWYEGTFSELINR